MLGATMIVSLRYGFVLVLLSLALVCPASGDPEHYASIRREHAFLREGPSYAHKVLWIYRRRNFPVKIIGSYDAWRRVKDVEGTVGWIHRTQLSEMRTVVFIGRTPTIVRSDSSPSSRAVAYAQRGVVAKLTGCKLQVCKVEISAIDGWVDKRSIWGVSLSELF